MPIQVLAGHRHQRKNSILLHPLIQTLIDGYLVSAFLRAYSGSVPRSVYDSVTGDFLADWTVLTAPTLANRVTSRSIQLSDTVSPGMCYIPGTPTFLRLFLWDGSEVQDIECGASGSGKDIILDDITLVAGNVETFTSWLATVNSFIT